MINTIAIYVGYTAMIFGCIIFVCCLLIGAGYAVNKTTWWLLDSYGGWKTFCEFRDWYHNQKDKS